MYRSKGSFSIIFLVALFFSLLFGQLLIYHLNSDYKRSFAFAQKLQQRRLCSSVYSWLMENKDVTSDINLSYSYPSTKETLSIKGAYTRSQDEFFDCYKTEVFLGDCRQNLFRLGFYPSQEIKSLAESYMFISRYQPTGIDKLNQDILYTSKGNFVMPSLSFLSDKASIFLEMATINKSGFSNNFVYLKQASTLSYTASARTLKGDTLIACTRSLTIPANFTASGKIVLISNESITIGNKVNLENVLIIAKGNVTIGSGCNIKGVIFSNSTIKFLGAGTFRHDKSVIEDHISATFIA